MPAMHTVRDRNVLNSEVVALDGSHKSIGIQSKQLSDGTCYYGGSFVNRVLAMSVQPSSSSKNTFNVEQSSDTARYSTPSYP